MKKGSLFEQIEKIRKEHEENEELKFQEYCYLNPITEEYIDQLIDKTFDLILERCATQNAVKIDFSKQCKGNPSQSVMDKYLDQMIDKYIKRLNEREPKLKVTSTAILGYRERFINF